MSTTQIPPGPTTPSPNEPSHREGGDIYSARQWESAYSDLHATPELLIQLQDDLARARKREAFWISVVVHIILAFIIINLDRIISFFPHSNVVVVSPKSLMNNKENTFLELPPDVQKVTKPPKSDIISDKDRIATSRIPSPTKDQLKGLLNSSRPGPRVPQPRPQPPAPDTSAQASPPQQQQAPPPEPKQMAKLQPPPLPQPKPSFTDNGLSAGSAIQQAARAAAANRGGYSGDNGDFGLGQGKKSSQILGPMDVLSDTMGVDFGPYLSRVLHDVKENWYNAIPESARPPLFKKGKVSIEFAILKDGTVAGMKLVTPSGDVALDRGAWSGITTSNPFPPLPTQFGGQYLALRFSFYYNPEDTADLR